MLLATSAILSPVTATSMTALMPFFGSTTWPFLISRSNVGFCAFSAGTAIAAMAIKQATLHLIGAAPPPSFSHKMGRLARRPRQGSGTRDQGSGLFNCQRAIYEFYDLTV